MQAEPREQHRWLNQLLGEWTSVCEMSSKPGAPPERLIGRETGRPVGALWVVLDGAAQMPGGGDATMQMTLGFDPDRNRFVGTWIGSMMTHYWIYDGELDAAGRVLSLHSDGPDFANPGKSAKYKDVITIVSDDERTLTGNVLGPDGQWHPMMEVRYRRAR